MPEPFVIFDLDAPRGGCIGFCRLPGRTGNLAGDIARAAEWQAAILVSLTEAAELSRHGVAGLPAAVETAGIPHAHFPIRDFGVPGTDDPIWPALSGRLHSLLDADRRVLLHCLGGQGRSGMVAMRLLSERGLAPDQALAALRRLRPQAVETHAQRLWAEAGARGGD